LVVFTPKLYIPTVPWQPSQIPWYFQQNNLHYKIIIFYIPGILGALRSF
jgi:hypothetical protein